MNLEKLMQLYDFTGQTVLITGGTGILGGEIACALAGCGAKLAILHAHPETRQALQERLGEAVGEANFFSCDVLNLDGLRKTAEEVLANFGKVDCLVNAAGGNRPGATTKPGTSFFDLPIEELRSVLDLNLLGTLLPCQAFGRNMAERGGGVILNISSMNAWRPLTRIPAYSAAKAGISNFTLWLAVHMAQEYSPGIRVNAIAPGFFLTRQNRFLLEDRDTGRWTPRGESILAHTPLGRFGKPEDLIGAVLWLLSPASAFVTGTVVPIDGGFSAYSGV
jgi:NAD(P)-dependent dehydrogenase (short-subunit alcohol dehydrogenase family)